MQILIDVFDETMKVRMRVFEELVHMEVFDYPTLALRVDKQYL